MSAWHAVGANPEPQGHGSLGPGPTFGGYGVAPLDTELMPIMPAAPQTSRGVGNSVAHGHVQGSAEDNLNGSALPVFWTGRQLFCEEFQPLLVSAQAPDRLDDNLESVVVAFTPVAALVFTI